MRKMRSILALLLVAALLAAALPFALAATPDCMDEDELRTLLNSVELRPQKTHYARMDALLERLTAPYDGLDNYDRLREAYDWVVMNVEYSWEPYSQDWAPAYDCFDVDCGLELDAGAEETMPYEVVNRAYYALTERKGVCYDYAALFAVIARYIGFESFVRTGEFIFETMARGITAGPRSSSTAGSTSSTRSATIASALTRPSRTSSIISASTRSTRGAITPRNATTRATRASPSPARISV